MDKVEQIHASLQRLVDQRKRRKEGGQPASEHDEEEEDRLLSALLSQLDSLKDSSEPLSSQAVAGDQKLGGENGTQEIGADEIVMELKKVKRQNTITHTLLSIMIVVTAFWQLSKVSILLSLKAKFSHPFRAAGNMISGFLKGGGNSQVLERPGSTSNKLLKAPPTPPVNIPELPHVNLPSMLLNVVEH